LIYTHYCLIFNFLQLFPPRKDNTLFGMLFFSLRFRSSFVSILLLSRRRSRGLPTTGWRLGAAAAFPHYLSNPHFPPPLRQTARYVLAF
jgi:hypothetical protein